jgi:ABC-type amino acid transport substrate-binding protein
VARFALVTVVLTAATIVGLRTVFATVLRHEFEGARVLYGMTTVFAPVAARVLPGVPDGEPVTGRDSYVRAILQRGALRVCVLPNRLPYAFADPQGQLKGFDVEMAHRLARDMGVRLEFVRVVLEDLPGVLERGGCDIAMSGIPVTPLRASALLFSEPYLDETLGWMVKDHLRDQFASWEAIRALGSMRVGAPDLPYYVQEVRDRAPALDVEMIGSRDVMQEFRNFDAFLLPAERASALTLLHPEFTVVVPEPDVIKVPLAYPISGHGTGWEAYVNTWIELKRRDGTIDRLYRHWILGRDAVQTRPRWSVARDVLHWVE